MRFMPDARVIGLPALSQRVTRPMLLLWAIFRKLWTTLGINNENKK
jgi:hypothetical protein